MQTFIVFENARDMDTLEGTDAVAGVDRLLVDGGKLSHGLAKSIAMTPDRRVVYIVETTSEHDRFFETWMQTKYEMIGNIASPLKILPAAPSLMEASKDPRWVSRLRSFLFPMEATICLADDLGNVKTIDAVKTLHSEGGLKLVSAKHAIERVLSEGTVTIKLEDTDCVTLSETLEAAGFFLKT